EIFEKAPFIGALLHNIRLRQVEIQEAHARFLAGQKKGNSIARLNDALNRKVISEEDVAEILRKFQKIREPSKSEQKTYTEIKSAIYGEHAPRQIFEFTYDLID